MNVQIKGEITYISAPKQITEKLTQVMIHVKENVEQYPQHYGIAVNNQSIDKLKGFNVGSMVEIDASLKGREYVAKDGKKGCFNTIELWKIVAVGGQVAQKAPQQQQPQQNFSEQTNEDLPF